MSDTFYGRFSYAVGGKKVTATFAGSPARWTVEAPWPAVSADAEKFLNGDFGPDQYGGPSDGYAFDRIVAEAAKFYAATPELPERAASARDTIH